MVEPGWDRGSRLERGAAQRERHGSSWAEGPPPARTTRRASWSSARARPERGGHVGAAARLPANSGRGAGVPARRIITPD
jgi:hypothetical protein